MRPSEIGEGEVKLKVLSYWNLNKCNFYKNL